MKKIKSLLLLAFFSCFAISAFAGDGNELTFKVKPEALGIIDNQSCDYTVHLEFHNSFVMQSSGYPPQHYYEQHYRYWVTDGSGNIISIPFSGGYMNITCYNPDGDNYNLTLNFYSGTTYQYATNWEEGFPVPRSYASYDWTKTRITHVIINTLSPSSYYGYSICPDVYYINAGTDDGTY